MGADIVGLEALIAYSMRHVVSVAVNRAWCLVPAIIPSKEYQQSSTQVSRLQLDGLTTYDYAL